LRGAIQTSLRSVIAARARKPFVTFTRDVATSPGEQKSFGGFSKATAYFLR
jgi:hypothetical protein